MWRSSKAKISKRTKMLVLLKLLTERDYFTSLQANIKKTKLSNSPLTWTEMYLKMWRRKWYVQPLKGNELWSILWCNWFKLCRCKILASSPRLSLATLLRVTTRPWPRRSRTACLWYERRENRGSWCERSRRKENWRQRNSNRRPLKLHTARFAQMVPLDRLV